MPFCHLSSIGAVLHHRKENGAKTKSELVIRVCHMAVVDYKVSGSDDRTDISLPASKRRARKMTRASLFLDYKTEVVVW